jgi:hypothetical protein
VVQRIGVVPGVRAERILRIELQSSPSYQYRDNGGDEEHLDPTGIAAHRLLHSQHQIGEQERAESQQQQAWDENAG